MQLLILYLYSSPHLCGSSTATLHDTALRHVAVMGDMKPTLTRRWSQVCRWLWVCVALWFLLFILAKSLLPHDNITSTYFRALGFEQRHSQSLLDSLDLDEEQCETSFPWLSKDVDDMIALGPFKLKQAGDGGPVQARIKDGQVRISFRCTTFLRAEHNFSALHHPFGKKRISLSGVTGCTSH